MSDGIHAAIGGLLLVALITLALAHTAYRTASEFNHQMIYTEAR